MNRAKRTILLVVAGALLGTIILGVGGRGVMRLLALRIGNEGVFSLGGSAEVVLYGALVGAAGGAGTALAAPLLRSHTVAGGLLLGLTLLGGTVATLPPHIAETAAPFADHMLWVWLLFGLCFLAWGLAMAHLAARA
jgi:hypothetical protein